LESPAAKRVNALLTQKRHLEAHLLDLPFSVHLV
jgi:hypothetical protein